MVKFRAKSITSLRLQHRIWRAAVVGMTSFSLIGGGIGSIQAELFPHRKIPKPAESVEPQSNSSFDNAIRTLLKEAKSAESKGDFDRALILAERAAKISEASASLVKASKDVSPEATARYAQELRVKRTELLVKKPAAAASRGPSVTKISVPQKMRKNLEKPKPERTRPSDDFPPTPTGSAPVAASNARVRLNSTAVRPADQASMASEVNSHRALSANTSEVTKLNERPVESVDFPVENGPSPTEFASNSTPPAPAITADEEMGLIDRADSNRTSNEFVISTAENSNTKKPDGQFLSPGFPRKSFSKSSGPMKANSLADDRTAMTEPADSFHEPPAPARSKGEMDHQVAADVRDLTSRDMSDESSAQLEPVTTVNISANSTPADQLTKPEAVHARTDLREALHLDESDVSGALVDRHTVHSIAVATNTESRTITPVSRIRKLRPQFVEKQAQEDAPVVQTQPLEAGLNRDAPGVLVTYGDPDSAVETDAVRGAEESALSPDRATGLDSLRSKTNDSEANDSRKETEQIELAEMQEIQVPVSIKLRPAFRDIQVRTSFASDADKQDPVEDPREEIELIASTDLSAESDANPSREPRDPPLTKSFKLRPLFRDPRFTTPIRSTPDSTDENPIPDSAAANLQVATVRKPVIGRTSIIHWRSASNRTDSDSAMPPRDETMSEDGEPGDQRTRIENASGSRGGRGEVATGSRRVSQSGSSHSSSPRRDSSMGSVAQASVVNSATNEKKVAEQTELRGSLWDSATAPYPDADARSSETKTESFTSAPLPPRRGGVQQTSFATSNHLEHGEPAPKSQSQSKSNSAPSQFSPVPNPDENEASSTALKKNKRPNEDDHAASTRAILSSGPIQQLANLAGVPRSTASAMLCVIGITLLIAGLWMIRASFGIKRN